MLTRPNDSDARGRGLMLMTYPPPGLADGDNNTQTGECFLSRVWIQRELRLIMFLFRGAIFCACVELLASLRLLLYFSLLPLICPSFPSTHLIHTSLRRVLLSSIFCRPFPSFSPHRVTFCHPLSLSPRYIRCHFCSIIFPWFAPFWLLLYSSYLHFYSIFYIPRLLFPRSSSFFSITFHSGPLPLALSVPEFFF